MIGELDKALTRGERANLVMRAELGDWKLKLALVMLDQFAGQNTECWPRMSTIAKCMNCHRRTAQAAISELTARGIVRYRDRLVGLASRRYTIDYVILADLQPVTRPQREMPTSLAPRAWDPSARCLPPQRQEPTYNTQAPSQRTFSEQSGGTAAAVCEDVSRRVARGEKEAEAKQVQRLNCAKLKAVTLLRGNRVWDRSIGELLEIAGRNNEGNSLPRVMEVIEMADKAGPADRGAWIKEAIEKGWKPSGRRTGVSA